MANTIISAKLPDKGLELFRFVNVRDPRYFNTVKNSGAYTIYADEEYESIPPAKRLYQDLKKVSTKPGDNQSPAEALYNATAAFRNTSEYLASPLAVRTAFAPCLEFMDAMTNASSEDLKTAYVLTEELLKQINNQAEPLLRNCQLWNNIFTYSLVRPAQTTLHLLLQAARAMHALRLFKEKTRFTPFEIIRLVVMLPADVFVPDLFTSQSAETPVANAETKPDGIEKKQGDIERRQLLLDTLTDLHKAIRFHKETIFGQAQSEDEAPAPVKSSGKKTSTPKTKTFADPEIISKDLLAYLGEESVAVLKNEKLDKTGLRIQFVTEELERLINISAKNIASSLPKGDVVFTLNGGLYRIPVEANTPESNIGQKGLPPSAGHPLTPQHYPIDPKEPVDQESLYYGFHSALYGPGKPLPIEWLIRPLCVGELKKVEQHVKCYRPGEIAHIENILKGESKKRQTRRLEHSEDTIQYESETQREEERDSQSTERFDMEKEVQTTISRNMSLDAGVSVSAQYGTVKLDAYANGSYSQSYQQSQRSAAEFSREVTESTRQSLVSRIKETRTTKIIREFEEKNKHELDNKNGEGNVVGVYRWVDKVYNAQVYNYGRRLMLQFQIPEPSSFFRFALNSQQSNGISSVIKPTAPDDAYVFNNHTPFNGPLNSFQTLNEYNYMLWAAYYGAAVNSPPASEIVVGKSFLEQPQEAMTTGLTNNTISMSDRRKADARFRMVKDELQLPDGYYAYSYSAVAGKYTESISGWSSLRIWVGQTHLNHWPGRANDEVMRPIGNSSGLLNNEKETLPVLFFLDATAGGGFNLKVVCKRTTELYDNWRIETYEAIIAAYQKKMQEYEDQLADMQTEMGVAIEGRNPRRNEDIIRTELKRRSIELMRSAHMNPIVSILPGSDAIINSAADNSPYLNSTKAVPEGKYMQFIEHCFEWANMTWIFYPYFWGKRGTPGKNHWVDLALSEDHDPLFAQFLRAGSSRVVVPVRPGFELAAMHFLGTGETWNGEDLPWVGSPLYVSVAEESKPVNGKPEGEPWDVVLPTDMVILQQQDGGINQTGLPCNG